MELQNGFFPLVGQLVATESHPARAAQHYQLQWVIPSTRHACKESWYCFHQNKYPLQDDKYRYHDFQKCSS